MSLKKVEQTKKEKFFRPWDLLIYGVVIAVTVALFIALIYIGTDTDDGYISAYYDGEVVFTYSFESDELDICMESNVKVESDADGIITLIFCTSDGSIEDGRYEDYNAIEIDKALKTVKVTDTDCSGRKDCMRMGIGEGYVSELIYCSPHSLLVQPASAFDGESDPEVPVG